MTASSLSVKVPEHGDDYFFQTLVFRAEYREGVSSALTLFSWQSHVVDTLLSAFPQAATTCPCCYIGGSANGPVFKL